MNRASSLDQGRKVTRPSERVTSGPLPACLAHVYLDFPTVPQVEVAEQADLGPSALGSPPGADRPAIRNRLPEVLIVRQSTQSGPQLVPPVRLELGNHLAVPVDLHPRTVRGRTPSRATRDRRAGPPPEPGRPRSLRACAPHPSEGSEQPSLGNSAVLNSASPIRTTTGTWPQYSNPLAANLMSSLSSSGMATK